MSSIYIYAFASVTLVSIISLVGVLTLSLKENLIRRSVFVLVALAVGALLGDSFIHLIPEAFDGALSTPHVSLLIIAGILTFFIIEKYLHWHHRHGNEEEEVHEKLHEPLKPSERTKRVHPMGQVILISDGFHNFIDGVIIGASYLVSIEIGIATTIAIILHEIPQEIGDFGVLLHAGYTKARALFFNFLSALTSVLGVILALWVGGFANNIIEWIVPIAAGGFIYVAGSDLIPELHKTRGLKSSFVQFFAILLGVFAMFLLLFVEA
jgi:zinc and cadmium transporter